jgi:hypothetical protein
MEYHKIETLFERDEQTFKVKPGVFKNRTYSLLKSWVWTEKIDGTNIRLIYEPQVPGITGSLRIAGKTDKASVPAQLVKWASDPDLLKLLVVTFPDAPVVLYGEGYGAGIQKGGVYAQQQGFILFDVLVAGKWWLSDENMRNVASKLALKAVPLVGTMSLEQATEMVHQGFASQVGQGAPAEGLVGRPAETLFDKKGARLITKLKTKDFAR